MLDELGLAKVKDSLIGYVGEGTCYPIFYLFFLTSELTDRITHFFRNL